MIDTLLTKEIQMVGCPKPFYEQTPENLSRCIEEHSIPRTNELQM